MNDYLRSLNPAMDPPEDQRPGQEPPAIISGEAETALADPGAILAQPKSHYRLTFRQWVAVAAVVLLMFELLPFLGPRPSQLVGDIAAQFYSVIQQTGNQNQLTLEEERILAHMLAEREAEYGAWQGRCAVVMFFDPQAAAVCMAAADAFYRQAIDSVERRRQELFDARQ